MIRSVPTSEKLFIGGDFNGHVGETSGGFEMMHRGFGYGDKNQEGERTDEPVWIARLYLESKAIKEKKECYKCLHRDKTDDNAQKYKLAKKNAKKAVSEARGRAYENLYQKLSTKEGEKDIYKIAKLRDRKTRDLNQVKCIKDETDRLLVKDDEIKNRWRKYFDKLFNGENDGLGIELNDVFDDSNRPFVRRI
ncbi:hypothetical protein LUZ63_002128 [Rhynchospora breviuscula]|uniref:Craniofacial development protein 2-like n=1 Tax=Rhynchospora breviuscula TaxID=2022672 RepID=A0A9Q0CZH5_9POAL|nr:hypothetical protein LUZ63_002128 [Rhynchospora breviuscula]